jgi:steroid delta-isomerase-like uncharacterized protein
MNPSAILKQNEWIIRQYFEEVWNKGNVDLLDKMIAPGYLNHSSSVANPIPGPDGLKPIIIAMRQAFPDLHYEIEDIIISPENVVARVVVSGTHNGDFFGIAPTNKKIRVNQINIERIIDGRITEHWRLTDELLLMKQLELIKVLY